MKGPDFVLFLPFVLLCKWAKIRCKLVFKDFDLDQSVTTNLQPQTTIFPT